MGITPQTRAALIRQQEQTRMKLAELQARGAFGGPGIPDDASPAEGLLEEYRRTVGIVRWMQLKLAEEFEDGLPDLGMIHEPMKGQPFLVPTHLAGWYDIYMKEREHLVKTSKLCLDAGIEERQLRLAERTADTMFAIINGVVAQLGLTDAQLSRVPTLIQSIIRDTIIPGELV